VPEKQEKAWSADQESEVEIHWMRRSGDESDVEAHSRDKPEDATGPEVEGHAFKI
jgi:hypothetical protein